MNISESCYTPVPSPTDDRQFYGFEKNFDYWWSFHWYKNNWWLVFYFVSIYLMAVAVGQRYMRSRPPFDLRLQLFFWNLTMALFSLVTTLRMIPEVAVMLREVGFYGSICFRGSTQHWTAISVWGFMFNIFKVLELGDTAFVVLRKKPLLFLHWYHHASVVTFSWASGAYPSAIQRHFFLANVSMHALVYSYYTLKALQVRIPRLLNIAITLLQILEMVFGVFVAWSAYRLKAQNPDCCVFDQAIKLAASIYATYFVLFTNFFIKSYITNKGQLFDEKGAIKKLA